MSKLDGVLKRHFAGAKSELDPFEPPSRVGGLIAWDGFRGVDMAVRVERVYDAIRKELKPAEAKRVALLIPLTLEELAVRKQEMKRDEAEARRTVLGS